MSAQKRLLDDLLVRGKLQVFERVDDEQHRTDVRVDLRTLVPQEARTSKLSMENLFLDEDVDLLN